MSFAEYLCEAVESFGKFPALVSGQGAISFEETVALVHEMSLKLETYKLPSGSRIGILMKNSPSQVLILLGIILSGHIAVLYNPSQPPERLHEQITHLDIEMMIGEEKVIPPAVFQKQYVWAEDLVCYEIPPIQRRMTHLRDRRVRPDNEPAMIIFTSGSSGVSKAVLHSFENFRYSAQGSNQVISFQPGDKWLVTLPFFHVSGLALIWRAFSGGGAVVFPDSRESLAWNISHQKVSHVSLVASQLYTLLSNLQDQETDPLAKMKAILLGGGPIPGRMWDQCMERNLAVFPTYGLSEMASSVTVCRTPIEGQGRLHAGNLLPYRELKISPDHEIWVRGQTLFLGYATKNGIEQPYDEEGWFHTGDLGFFDDQQRLHLLGRLDLRFISGGENIYPEEIEDQLLRIPGVEEALVVPVSDEKYGARPEAFVRTRRNLEDLASSLPNELSCSLPKFKIPRKIHPWPEDAPKTDLKRNRAFFMGRVV